MKTYLTKRMLIGVCVVLLGVIASATSAAQLGKPSVRYLFNVVKDDDNNTNPWTIYVHNGGPIQKYAFPLTVWEPPKINCRDGYEQKVHIKSIELIKIPHDKSDDEVFSDLLQEANSAQGYGCEYLDAAMQLNVLLKKYPDRLCKGLSLLASHIDDHELIHSWDLEGVSKVRDPSGMVAFLCIPEGAFDSPKSDVEFRSRKIEGYMVFVPWYELIKLALHNTRGYYYFYWPYPEGWFVFPRCDGDEQKQWEEIQQLGKFQEVVKAVERLRSIRREGQKILIHLLGYADPDNDDDNISYTDLVNHLHSQARVISWRLALCKMWPEDDSIEISTMWFGSKLTDQDLAEDKTAQDAYEQCMKMYRARGGNAPKGGGGWEAKPTRRVDIIISLGEEPSYLKMFDRPWQATKRERQMPLMEQLLREPGKLEHMFRENQDGWGFAKVLEILRQDPFKGDESVSSLPKRSACRN